MRGDPPIDREPFRYVKFAWDDLSNLPPIGKPDYIPKSGGAFRIFEEGKFDGEHTRVFSAIKKKEDLPALGRCVYCRCQADNDGNPLKLTSEHVIPEFLGAGLELPAASCAECQKTTADFESSIATSMFDPVRKALLLKGKGGILEKTNFPLDIGRETTQREFIPLKHFPTILVMPTLFPAASYSHRSPQADDLFNFRMFNINANPEYLEQYELADFSSQTIDLVHFSQMIAKIAHVYGTYHFGFEGFRPTVAEFVRFQFSSRKSLNCTFCSRGVLMAAEATIYRKPPRDRGRKDALAGKNNACCSSPIVCVLRNAFLLRDHWGMRWRNGNS